MRALENLAKHFGLLVQSVEHAGSLDVVERLQAAHRFTRRMISQVPADVPVVEGCATGEHRANPSARVG